MLSRIIWFIILIVAAYLLLVFVSPDFADKYGNKDINTKIRNIKDQSLRMSSDESFSTSLWNEITGKTEQFASGTKQFVDETKETMDHIQSTLSEKTEQVKQATDSVQKAYDAVNTAKNDIQKLSSFSGAVKP